MQRNLRRRNYRKRDPGAGAILRLILGMLLAQSEPEWQQEATEDGTCSRCILYEYCPAKTDSVPEEWKEIHYPRMTSNTTIEYLKDGRVQLITYGRSEDAEKAFKEMKNNGI